MKVWRKDLKLNDAIEALDDVLARAQGDIPTAYGMLTDLEMEWILSETSKCIEPRYYLENYHCIRDEKGNFRALYPFWDHQEIVYEEISRQWSEGESCWIIVLKPRQAGISTWTSALMFQKTIFTPHAFTMLVAQDPTTSAHVYNMSINAYHALPWWLKPEYLYKTKGDQIEFQRADDRMRSANPGLGSILQCSHAQKMSGVAIGRSIRNLHASEASRWPDSGLFESDIKPSMNAPDTLAVIESTGWGRNGFFYETWTGAVAGENEFTPVFIPVYKVKKYSFPVKGVFEPTAEEAAVTARVLKQDSYQIPNEFWMWRRRRLRAASTGSSGKAGFLESYPLTPHEAFQASGMCAFDRGTLDEQTLRYVCKPLWAGEIFLAGDNVTPQLTGLDEVADDEVLPKRKGERPSKRLHVWRKPEPGRTYYVGADVALGVEGGDYSNGQVFLAGEGSEPDEQVAEWWGHTPPQQFARVLAALGYWYNGAEIACEYMQAGITTGDKLVELDYPALYRERMKDRPGGAYKPYFHFVTNVKTRESIIATMNESLLSHNRAGQPGVILHSEELLDEMTDFGSEGGRMEGQGNNDDGVMGAQICLYCLRETSAHLKGPGTDAPERTDTPGDMNQYGVYDEFGRQRGQYASRGAAEAIVENKDGWKVNPIMICKANTLYSPIFDELGPEHKLRFTHGMRLEEITPDLVYAFRGATNDVASGISADPDWT